MKKVIKEIWPYVLMLFLLAIMIMGLLSLNGCTPKESYFKCVVDSVWLAPQASVAEPYPLYHFHTDCGVTTTSASNAFKKGDTVKFIKN